MTKYSDNNTSDKQKFFEIIGWEISDKILDETVTRSRRRTKTTDGRFEENDDDDDDDKGETCMRTRLGRKTWTWKRYIDYPMKRNDPASESYIFVQAVLP